VKSTIIINLKHQGLRI